MLDEPADLILVTFILVVSLVVLAFARLSQPTQSASSSPIQSDSSPPDGGGGRIVLGVYESKDEKRTATIELCGNRAEIAMGQYRWTSEGRDPERYVADWLLDVFNESRYVHLAVLDDNDTALLWNRF